MSLFSLLSISIVGSFFRVSESFCLLVRLLRKRERTPFDECPISSSDKIWRIRRDTGREHESTSSAEDELGGGGRVEEGLRSEGVVSVQQWLLSHPIAPNPQDDRSTSEFFLQHAPFIPQNDEHGPACESQSIQQSTPSLRKLISSNSIVSQQLALLVGKKKVAKSFLIDRRGVDEKKGDDYWRERGERQNRGTELELVAQAGNSECIQLQFIWRHSPRHSW